MRRFRSDLPTGSQQDQGDAEDHHQRHRLSQSRPNVVQPQSDPKHLHRDAGPVNAVGVVQLGGRRVRLGARQMRQQVKDQRPRQPQTIRRSQPGEEGMSPKWPGVVNCAIAS